MDGAGVPGDAANATQAFVNSVQQAISQTATWYTLVLRPVQNGPFAAEFDITVSNLELPQQINLAAPASQT
jgi:hypothetical protein